MKSQRGGPPLARPPLGIARGTCGDPANQSAKLPAGLGAVHVFKVVRRSGQLVTRLGGIYRPVSEDPADKTGAEANAMRAVFLAKVDTGGVLYD